MTTLLKDIITPDPKPFSRNYAGHADPRANRPAGAPFRRAAEAQLEWYDNEYRSRKDMEVNLSELRLAQASSQPLNINRLGKTPLLLQTPHGAMQFRTTGLRNLCSLVGAPFDFVSELPADYAVRDINYMIARAGSKSIKLRTAEGGLNCFGVEGDRKVRAIVSPRYAAHDLPHLLDTVAEALDRASIGDSAYVMEAHVGSTTRMWLTLSPQMRGADGFPVTPGIKIRNGESGNSSIGVDPGFLRTICTNGLIHHDAARGLRSKHTGDSDELAANIACNLPRLFDEAHQLTNAANLAGASRVQFAAAERAVQATFLNKKQQSYVMRVACAEARWRELAAAAEISWHDRGVRHDDLEPVSASVYEELSRASERACDIIAADIMNGMTQLAQQFDSHKRQRTERAAHEVLYAVQPEEGAESALQLDLTADDIYRRNAAFHRAVITN